ncbi:MAG TPA: putative metallopeptidase [Candidatus Angelobacter sp.]|nr:putative metallopeptidase [Candidatus Angelobacter sp.]
MKRLILGGDPDAKFPVPSKHDFEVQGDWIQASGCEKIAKALIESRASLAPLVDANIAYLWKASGGSRKGKVILGTCQRPSGLLRYFSAMDFVIWFGADNCRDSALDYWQMEALVFHELKHAGMEDEVPVSLPHDFEGFAEEIRLYGLWKRDIVGIAKAVTESLKLPFPETLPFPESK